jgi:hypothetical protein
MNLVNHTPLAADYTTTHNKAGSECLVIVIKATYCLPLAGAPAELMAQQVPIVVADTATGEPGLSAPEYECEFNLGKPKVDVLLLGTAYAPKGIAARQVGVGMRVGDMSKAFNVTGKRTWKVQLMGVVASATKPEPFTQQAISYDIAFGGVETGPKLEKDRAAYLPNPVGFGYYPHYRYAHGMPVAQTEELKKPITSPDSKYRPMSFGPVGRNWLPRSGYAGTYDQKWQDEEFPFLPADFDGRYFNAAPEDQQLPELKGGETVVLVNLTHPALTPSGRLEFQLPDLAMHVMLLPKKGIAERVQARADTLLIEPDKQRFSVVWRVVKDLQNNPFRYKTIEIGERPKVQIVKIPLEALAGELPSRRDGYGDNA